MRIFHLLLRAIIAEDYHERNTRAYRWTSTKALPVSMYWKRLDRVTSDDVC